MKKVFITSGQDSRSQIRSSSGRILIIQKVKFLYADNEDLDKTG